jgi:Flp pilus assembly CpaE family ATPase
MVGRTILVLDTSATSRNFLAALFRAKQFTVLEADSGMEALISAWRDLPDLILFDPALSDIKHVEFVGKLRRDHRTANTPIIALSGDPEPAIRDALLRAGVSEHLIKSAEAVGVLEQSVSRLLGSDRPTAPVDQEEAARGLLVVFLSAKGGTGTSSLCANLAMNIQRAEPGSRHVVADLVLPIGSIAPIVGYEGDVNLVTVAGLPSGQTNGEYFRKSLPVPALWNFQLLAGSPDPQHGNVIEGDRIAEIVDTLRSAYDFILLDIGRSLSRISLPLIQQADLITLIVSTDLSTVKLTRTVCEYLHAQGIDQQKIYAILNRAVGLEGATKAEAEEIIGLPIKTTVPYMGGNFSLANNLHQPITFKYPNDTASIVLRETAADMAKIALRLHNR